MIVEFADAAGACPPSARRPNRLVLRTAVELARPRRIDAGQAGQLDRVVGGDFEEARGGAVVGDGQNRAEFFVESHQLAHEWLMIHR